MEKKLSKPPVVEIPIADVFENRADRFDRLVDPLRNLTVGALQTS